MQLGLSNVLGRPRDWRISDIDGAKLWLRSDLGVTTAAGAVSSWTDQHGTHDATQSVAASRPTYITSGGLQGQPYLSLDGVDDYLRQDDSPELDAGQESWLLLMVVRFTRAIGTWDGIWGKTLNASLDNIRCFRNGAGQPIIYTDGTAYTAGTFVMATDTDYVLAMGIDSGSSEIIYWGNGAHQRKAIVLAGAGTNAERAGIGGSTGEASQWPGAMRLYEMAYYRFGAGVAIPDETILRGFDWLKARYGL